MVETSEGAEEMTEEKKEMRDPELRMVEVRNSGLMASASA